MPVFANEEMLRVGFLTAAYELWFKNFGYSWVLQSSLNIVREQILNPEKALISWNYLIETPAREILNPNIGLMRFGKMYFPIAQIYDQIIILPSATQVHPPNSGPDEMSMKQLNFSPVIDNRFQSRCAGPAVLTCDGQEIVSPDLVATPTIPLQIIRIDPWI